MKRTVFIAITGLIALLLLAGCESDPDNGDDTTDGDQIVADGDESENDSSDGDTIVDGDAELDGDVVSDGDEEETDGDTDDENPADGDTDLTDGDTELDGDPDLDIEPDKELSDGDSVDSDLDLDIEPDEDNIDLNDSESGSTILLGDLLWQNPPSDSQMSWDDAVDYCNDLDLDGYIDWRLPSIGELRTLIRGCPATETDGSCNVHEDDCVSMACRDAACDGCTENDGPTDGCYWPHGFGGECFWYWSSTVIDGMDGGRWLVYFPVGGVGDDYISGNNAVRCVRTDAVSPDGDLEADSDFDHESDTEQCPEMWEGPSPPDCQQWDCVLESWPTCWVCNIVADTSQNGQPCSYCEDECECTEPPCVCQDGACINDPNTDGDWDVADSDFVDVDVIDTDDLEVDLTEGDSSDDDTDTFENESETEEESPAETVNVGDAEVETDIFADPEDAKSTELTCFDETASCSGTVIDPETGNPGGTVDVQDDNNHVLALVNDGQLVAVGLVGSSGTRDASQVPVGNRSTLAYMALSRLPVPYGTQADELELYGVFYENIPQYVVDNLAAHILTNGHIVAESQDFESILDDIDNYLASLGLLQAARNRSVPPEVADEECTVYDLNITPLEFTSTPDGMTGYGKYRFRNLRPFFRSIHPILDSGEEMTFWENGAVWWSLPSAPMPVPDVSIGDAMQRAQDFFSAIYTGDLQSFSSTDTEATVVLPLNQVPIDVYFDFRIDAEARASLAFTYAFKILGVLFPGDFASWQGLVAELGYFASAHPDLAVDVYQALDQLMEPPFSRTKVENFLSKVITFMGAYAGAEIGEHMAQYYFLLAGVDADEILGRLDDVLAVPALGVIVLNASVAYLSRDISDDCYLIHSFPRDPCEQDSDCISGWGCQQGECYLCGTCSDGETECNQGSYRECYDHDDGCYLWDDWQVCPDGWCQDAETCGVCDHECEEGETECLNSEIRSCETDELGCRMWGDYSVCPDNGWCADGTSCTECVHECETEGTACNGDTSEACTVDDHGCRIYTETVCEHGCDDETGECYGDACGNGRIDDGEVCEQGDTVDCTSLGGQHTGGTATCNNTCDEWDRSGCQFNTTPGFVPITAGSFWMGSPEGECPDDYPGDCTSELERYYNEVLHEVTLTYDFEMMTTEVTQGQWRAVAQTEGWGEDPSYFSSCGDDCPVEMVNWFEALQYANALSRNAGLSECYVLSDCTEVIGSSCENDISNYCFGYDCATVALNSAIKPQECEGFRLPTEAEWEYAIRAGTTTAFYNGGIAQALKDPLDPNLNEIGWYGGNSGVEYTGGWNCNGWYPDSTTCGTQPVASKDPNSLGLYDMSGNVYEWNWDWYQTEYQNDVAIDPVGPTSGSYQRIVRGGYWGHHAYECRSARRYVYKPMSHHYGVGFRLARSLHGTAPDGDLDEDLDYEIDSDTEEEWGDWAVDLEEDGDNEEEVELDEDADTNTIIVPDFVPIAAGSFWMGSPEGCPGPDGYPGDCTEELGRYSDEILHYVLLTYNFEMSRYETTQENFETLMGWNPSYFGPNGSGSECGNNCPVEYISWFDALAYANELSQNAGLLQCYVLSNVECVDGTTVGSNYLDCMNTNQRGINYATVTLNEVTVPQGCNGYRLPTEAEWEYAIRGGTTTAFYNGEITYTGANPLDPNLDQIGWYGGNRGDFITKPVGGKAANTWDINDMSGNVWEWIWDWNWSYSTGTVSNPDIDPTGPNTGEIRVLRGGSWSYDALFCRSAHRNGYFPDSRSSSDGFRLARSLHGILPDGDMDEVLDYEVETDTEDEWVDGNFDFEEVVPLE